MFRTTQIPAFRLCMSTGILAAGLAADAHIFALRWASSARVAKIRRVVARWQTIVGPSAAARQYGLDVYRVTGYTAAHTGGVVFGGVTAPNLTLDTVDSVSVLDDARISDTAALVDGTFVADADPLDVVHGAECQGAPATQKTSQTIDMSFSEEEGGALVLRADQGIVIRNRVVTIADFTAAVVVKVKWEEIPV